MTYLTRHLTTDRLKLLLPLVLSALAAISAVARPRCLTP